MTLDWEQAVPDRQPHPIHLGWVRNAGPQASLQLIIGGQVRSAVIEAGPAACLDLELGSIAVQAGRVRARLASSAGGLLDYIEIRP
jgi:hypothetical protein